MEIGWPRFQKDGKPASPNLCKLDILMLSFDSKYNYNVPILDTNHGRMF